MTKNKLLFTVGIIIGLFVIISAILIISNPFSVKNTTPTISVEQAMAEIQEKMTAEAFTALSAAATQTAMAPTATPVPTSTPEPAAGMVQISPVDGAEMVYIPAGVFWMGAQQNDPEAQLQELPIHEVMLDGYWIDKEFVTNEMYMRCVESGRCSGLVSHDDINPNYGKPEFMDYPAVYATWDQAKAYCEAVGRRLPTEAEWEKAARGTDGRLYPWGNTPPDAEHANYDNANTGVISVGTYPLGASPYGVLDMAGNARQWVHDWYDENYYVSSAASGMPVNPVGPAEGAERVIRGGSFKDPAVFIRTASRLKHEPDSPGENRGFRCAVSDVSPY